MDVKVFDQISGYLEDNIKKLFSTISPNRYPEIQEIRLRANRPISVIVKGDSFFVDSYGGLQKVHDSLPTVTAQQIGITLNKMCQYSVHTFLPQLKEGYLTISGGHRVGISANLLYGEEQKFSLNEITSLNIRIARDVQGCAMELSQMLYAKHPAGTLIVGSPSSGKTTLLRDIGRILSSGDMGKYYKVVAIDSRGELGGMYKHQMYEGAGICIDYIAGCEKSVGILQAIRVLSPDVIICDEAGTLEEVSAIEGCLNAGVVVITTAHATSLEEMQRRPQIMRLLHSGAFSYYTLLEGAKSPGAIKKIGRVQLKYEDAGCHYRVHLCDV